MCRQQQQRRWPHVTDRLVRCAGVLLSLFCSSVPPSNTQQSALESHFGSHIRVSGAKGRSGSYEVNASLETSYGVATQPTLLHSKLQSGKFPDTSALIAQIQHWAQTGKA